MEKEEVKLTIQEKPTYTCIQCGFEDYMGNLYACPICAPEEAEKEDYCYFVDYERELCRQDGLPCSFVKDKNWEDCPKLEGLGKKQ